MTPRQIAEALSEIETADGRITPADVVEVARSPNHPLHSFFTWDDAEAAHKQRLDEARGLIRRYRVVVTTSTVRVEIPNYIRAIDQHGAAAGYRRTDATPPEERRHALDAELRRLSGLLNRTAGIATALGAADVAATLSDMRAQAEAIAHALHTNQEAAE